MTSSSAKARIAFTTFCVVAALALFGCLGANTPVALPLTDASDDLQLVAGQDGEDESDGNLADGICGAAQPDPADKLCRMCLVDMPAYVTRTVDGVHARLNALYTEGHGGYNVFEHICPNGVRQLGYIANGWDIWYFTQSGVLVGYSYRTDVIWDHCPSGVDDYGDTTCSDWTGSVYTTPNTTIYCDTTHFDAHVLDANSGAD